MARLPKATLSPQYDQAVDKIVKRASVQSAKFIAKARELGCDENEAEFEAKLRKIAKGPADKPKPAKKSKKPA